MKALEAAFLTLNKLEKGNFVNDVVKNDCGLKVTESGCNKFNEKLCS